MNKQVHIEVVKLISKLYPSLPKGSPLTKKKTREEARMLLEAVKDELQQAVQYNTPGSKYICVMLSCLAMEDTKYESTVNLLKEWIESRLVPKSTVSAIIIEKLPAEFASHSGSLTSDNLGGKQIRIILVNRLISLLEGRPEKWINKAKSSCLWLNTAVRGIQE